MSSPTTPLGAITRGVVAGLAGTLALDLFHPARCRQRGGP